MIVSRKDGRGHPEWFFYLPINPEPWAIGPLYTGRFNNKIVPKIGRNQQLASFQQAVKEALQDASMVEAPEGYDLYFFFWRRLDDYETESGKRHRKHVVDSTNMQKATEDAIQGILITNDRFVRQVGSEIIEQDGDAKPGIVMRVRPYTGHNSQSVHIPPEIWRAVLTESPGVVESNNDWNGPG